MRALLLAAVVAVAGMVYLLVASGDPASDPHGRGREEQTGAPVADPAGKGAPRNLPDPRAEPDRFVETAAGEGRLDEILAFLKSGKDQQFQPRWVFGKDGLTGFPTLRSVYITALGKISGKAAREALTELLDRTARLEEAYLAALLLAGRRETGWETAALERVAAKAAPRFRPIRSGLLFLAVASAPTETAEFLVRQAPRGESTDRPVMLSRALSLLPWGQAEPASRALVADPAVTPLAKILYLTAFLERREVAAIATLTDMAERRELNERMRIEAAYAVVRAKAFDVDRIAIQTALAKGDTAAAAQHRERLELRRTEAKRFIHAALGFDLDTSDDPKAAPLRRLLNRS